MPNVPRRRYADAKGLIPGDERSLPAAWRPNIQALKTCEGNRSANSWRSGVGSSFFLQASRSRRVTVAWRQEVTSNCMAFEHSKPQGTRRKKSTLSWRWGLTPTVSCKPRAHAERLYTWRQEVLSNCTAPEHPNPKACEGNRSAIS